MFFIFTLSLYSTISPVVDATRILVLLLHMKMNQVDYYEVLDDNLMEAFQITGCTMVFILTGILYCDSLLSTGGWVPRRTL